MAFPEWWCCCVRFPGSAQLLCHRWHPADSWCCFPIANKPCGSAEQKGISCNLGTSYQLLNFASLPHFWPYQLSPTGSSLCVVGEHERAEDMAEDGCSGMKTTPRREAGICLAAIKGPQMLLQHTAPNPHQLHKPYNKQSYLSSQFIPLDKAFLLVQLQMLCI